MTEDSVFLIRSGLKNSTNTCYGLAAPGGARKRHLTVDGNHPKRPRRVLSVASACGLSASQCCMSYAPVPHVGGTWLEIPHATDGRGLGFAPL
jgi:hypothetical protein